MFAPEWSSDDFHLEHQPDSIQNLQTFVREWRFGRYIECISWLRRGEAVKMQDYIVMQADFESEYSSSNERSQEDFKANMKETEALLWDLDMNPDFELESVQKLLWTPPTRRQSRPPLMRRAQVFSVYL